MNDGEMTATRLGGVGHYKIVGLLVAIARERSEAIYLGYVFFCTYGTKVLACSIRIWKEAPDCIRATRFSWDESVARGVREEACCRA